MPNRSKGGILPLNATLLTALAARTAQPQEVAEVQDLGPELALARRVAEREDQRSLFAQPLFAKGHPVGVLTIAKPTPCRFTQWEREFMRAFADPIAVAMENARLNEELSETLHLRDEFLSVAAHELRTPITALRGYVQLLLRSKVPRPREERQGLEAIERQRYVFEPFFEPYPAGTPGYSGVTGVGLYVAKTFVERLGGRVWFVSEEGQGSTFFFALPLSQG